MVTAPVLIIVPSRERPANAQRLLKTIKEVTPEGSFHITFAVDYNDDTKWGYPPGHTELVTGGSMVAALNEIAVTESKHYPYLAFLGDDTLPHAGWYDPVITALKSQKNSIVYGNDLIHGQFLPTSVFMDSNIVNTLGYMAPPNQKQLFVDNYWKALGEDLGTLTYLNDVIIEHLHPLVGKAPSDASYVLSNSFDRWKHDEEAYNSHIINQHPLDLEKLR